MSARRFPPRSREIMAKVIKPKRGQYLLPVMIVRGLIPNLRRLDPGFKGKRGPKDGRSIDRDRHMAYEVVRLVRGAADMSEAQAIPAAKRAVAGEFGCQVRTVTSALAAHSKEAQENQPGYISELQTQGLLGK